MAPVFFTDAQGRRRVQSFKAEAAANRQDLERSQTQRWKSD